MDVFARTKRSALMARIKSENTKPGRIVESLVASFGRRFRAHVDDLPGKPDLVLGRDRKVIFVHGFFWHQHAGCPVAKIPSSRRAYWLPKLVAYKRRDRKNGKLLREARWSVLVVRECHLLKPDRVRGRVATFLSYGGPAGKATAGARNAIKHKRRTKHA